MKNETYDSKFFSFDGKIAEQFGVDAAVLIQNLKFWIEKNALNGKHFFEGKTWTYNSKRAFSEQFPFYTERQIKYALEKLRKEQVIEVANFNRAGYDKTLWYCFVDEQKFGIPPNKSTENQNCFDETKLSNDSETNNILGSKPSKNIPDASIGQNCPIDWTKLSDGNKIVRPIPDTYKDYKFIKEDSINFIKQDLEEKQIEEKIIPVDIAIKPVVVESPIQLVKKSNLYKGFIKKTYADKLNLEAELLKWEKYILKNKQEGKLKAEYYNSNGLASFFDSFCKKALELKTKGFINKTKPNPISTEKPIDISPELFDVLKKNYSLLKKKIRCANNFIEKDFINAILSTEKINGMALTEKALIAMFNEAGVDSGIANKEHFIEQLNGFIKKVA